MKLTDFQTKIAWGVVILFILCLWMIFPLIFKTLINAYNLPENFNQFGAFGDIYGSLNTLFTSATLIIVLYSAYLQREANKDTRQAMADQLKEAKDARKEQLDLAESNHAAQISESRYAIFSTMLNILLNQKDAVLEKCGWGKNNFEPNKIFVILANDFEYLLQGELKDYLVREETSEKKIGNDLMLSMYKLQNLLTFEELTSYFYMFVPLINLIKNTKLDSADKATYFSIISNSMTYSEQVTLLWFTAISQDFQDLLTDTNLLNAYFDENFAKFIKNNFNQSMFGHPRTLEYWK